MPPILTDRYCGTYNLLSYFNDYSYVLTKTYLSHNDLHLGNIMRNIEGDFDPNELVFVDFDLAAYGARAFDINYHTSYWLPDWGE